MPPRPDDRIPCMTRWMRMAQKDLVRAEKRVHEGDYEAAAFRIQQAVEKALKAALVAESVPPPRTHDLDTLLAMLPLPKGRGLQGILDLEQVSGWVVATRYPDAPRDDSATPEAVQDAAAQARRLLRRVQEDFCGPQLRNAADCPPEPPAPQ